MIRLGVMLNAELQGLVKEINKTLKGHRFLRLAYSNVPSEADTSAVDMIHPIDAWHPSPKGHDFLAEKVFLDLQPSLRFLGISAK